MDMALARKLGQTPGQSIKDLDAAMNASLMQENAPKQMPGLGAEWARPEAEYDPPIHPSEFQPGDFLAGPISGAIRNKIASRSMDKAIAAMLRKDMVEGSLNRFPKGAPFVEDAGAEAAKQASFEANMALKSGPEVGELSPMPAAGPQLSPSELPLPAKGENIVDSALPESQMKKALWDAKTPDEKLFAMRRGQYHRDGGNLLADHVGWMKDGPVAAEMQRSPSFIDSALQRLWKDQDQDALKRALEKTGK